jgi:isoleucyl-tRNA synthetase
MVEIDRYALAMTAQMQKEAVADYARYQFHLVAQKLQAFCSEDLGAFYLDVLKDRLYTTAPKSPARRSAQTALWQLTQAMLRWMAPFLSFTAEEAWAVAAPGQGSIFKQVYWDFAGVGATTDAALLTKWQALREVRDAVNKAIEDVRTTGTIGSSLQAEVSVTAPPEAHTLLASLGEDLKFVFITSKATLREGDALAVTVTPSAATKCERCWHWRDDVGAATAHPTICGRCVANLYGDGDSRSVA